jgi:hypothetical protein
MSSDERTRSSRRRRCFRDRARRRPSEVSRFIEEHRGRFGVEPICSTLGVSASAYYQRATGQRSQRVVEDERLLARIECVHAANYHCYGYRRSGLALKREGVDVGRDRVKRLMRAHGIQSPQVQETTASGAWKGVRASRGEVALHEIRDPAVAIRPQLRPAPDDDRAFPIDSRTASASP